MLKNNEYFYGKAKSIGFDTAEGKATVGVMEAGDYEFGTAGAELMTVVSGSLAVKLPLSDKWQTFDAGTEFRVEAQSKFQLRVQEPSAYLCRYL
jgi:purine/pyrimidine-nucleoside phosphorylase